MVLYSVVCPPRYQFCYLGPLIPPLLMRVVDNAILFLRPRSLLYLRIQMVVPSLAALLPYATFQVLGNQCPAFGAILSDEVHHALVFLFGPRTFSL